MAAKRLTDLGVERLPSPAEGRIEVWDSLTPGLGVRIGSRRKSFIVMLRVDGRQKRVTLGSFPAMTIAQARQAAQAAIALARNGEDPLERKRADAAERTEARRNTVAVVVEEFIDRYARPRQRSWRDTAGRLRNNLVAHYGERPISALTRADLVRMLDAATARGLGVGANRILANTKTFLRWCVERGLIDRSPAEMIRAPALETARDRILTDDELAAVWRAAKAYGFPFGSIVPLLILTGQRRDEVAHMCWEEIDQTAAAWTIPPDKNKSGRPHLVPLAPLALEIISRLTPVGPPSSQRAPIFTARQPSQAGGAPSAASMR